MFSRKEREFLVLIAGHPGEDLEGGLSRRFPNPVYRRKLLWGIRKKALAAAEDWELYARAAQHDARVLRPQPSDDVPPVPLHTEPFAFLVKKLAELSRPRSRRPGGPLRGREP